MPQCSVSGCESKSRANGLCNKHLMRMRLTGTTDPGPKAHAPIEVRFMRHFTKGKPDECWIWRGRLNAHGYGDISIGKVGEGAMLAHRLSWEIMNGRSPPSDKVIMHVCDTPACVNPAHLRLGTQSENVRDMQLKRRHVVVHARGCDHHSARFTDELVREIRKSKLSNRELADIHGVNIASIQKIKSRKTWKHVT